MRAQKRRGLLVSDLLTQEERVEWDEMLRSIKDVPPDKQHRIYVRTRSKFMRKYKIKSAGADGYER